MELGVGLCCAGQFTGIYGFREASAEFGTSRDVLEAEIYGIRSWDAIH
jgi:hypothetical protein